MDALTTSDFLADYEFDEERLVYVDAPLQGWLKHRTTQEWFAFDVEVLIPHRLWHWRCVPFDRQAEDPVPEVEAVFAGHSGAWLSVLEDARGDSPRWHGTPATRTLDRPLGEMLVRFVSGAERSPRLAGELEVVLDELFGDEEPFASASLALASYRPEGGEFLYGEAEMAQLLRRVLDVMGAPRMNSADYELTVRAIFRFADGSTALVGPVESDLHRLTPARAEVWANGAILGRLTLEEERMPTPGNPQRTVVTREAVPAEWDSMAIVLRCRQGAP